MEFTSRLNEGKSHAKYSGRHERQQCILCLHCKGRSHLELDLD